MDKTLKQKAEKWASSKRRFLYENITEKNKQHHAIIKDCRIEAWLAGYKASEKRKGVKKNEVLPNYDIC
jgi:hypothetical protein